MGRNVVIFSDGTGQAGGVRPDQRLSNVYKLYRAARVGPDNDVAPDEQIAFYDAGLGTDDDARGALRVVRLLRKLLGSATGRGISTNIADCYEFLVNNWRPGDRIFIFGFSRGAYTARCVANVVALCGVPTWDGERPLVRSHHRTRQIAREAVERVYEHGAGWPRNAYADERRELGRRFRQTYRSADAIDPDRANAHPHFIGVFDTVAALGSKGLRRIGIVALFAAIAAIAAAGLALAVHLAAGAPWWTAFAASCAAVLVVAGWRLRRGSVRRIDDWPAPGEHRSHRISWRADNYDGSLDAHVTYARHAIAIDETRADFARVKWGNRGDKRAAAPGAPEPLIQMWFAGNHSDIGGSYEEGESRLSDAALLWMVDEATSIPGPLVIDRSKLNLFPSARGPQHCEVEAFRDKVDAIVPRWWPARLRPGWAEAPRVEALGSVFHPTVAERFALDLVSQAGRDGAYRPRTLEKDERFATYYSSGSKD